MGVYVQAACGSDQVSWEDMDGGIFTRKWCNAPHGPNDLKYNIWSTLSAGIRLAPLTAWLIPKCFYSWTPTCTPSKNGESMFQLYQRYAVGNGLTFCNSWKWLDTY